MTRDRWPSPALWTNRTLPGARVHPLARRPGPQRRAGFPPDFGPPLASRRLPSPRLAPYPSPLPDRRIAPARAPAAQFVPREFGGHSRKRGALPTGIKRGAHAAQLSGLDQHGVPPAPPARFGPRCRRLPRRRAGSRPGRQHAEAARAAIRFLHRTAGLPSPTDTAEVSETMAGIRRDALNSKKERAATLAVLRELLVPIPDDVRRLRDSALRRSESPRSCSATSSAPKGFSAGAEAEQGVADRRGAGPPALRPHRALPCARDGALARRRRDHRGTGVSAHLGPPQGVSDVPPPLPAIGAESLTPRSIARIVQARAAAAGFSAREFAGHSLKRGARSTGKQAGAHAASSGGSAATSRLTCSANTWSSATCSTATRSAACYRGSAQCTTYPVG